MLTRHVFPSLLSADFGNLQAEIQRLEPLVQGFHFDVMDGHFVPNLTMGAPILKKLKFNTPVDVHLMVTNPLERIREFAAAGAKMISFHIEAAQENAVEIIALIHTEGMRAGIAVKPKTPVSAIADFLPELDYALIMSVEPGFSGQQFQPEVLDKVRTLRSEYPDLDIEIDGGVNAETISEITAAGANMVVTGAYLFGAADPAQAVSQLLA